MITMARAMHPLRRADPLTFSPMFDQLTKGKSSTIDWHWSKLKKYPSFLIINQEKLNQVSRQFIVRFSWIRSFTLSEAISCHNFSSCCHFVIFGLVLFVVLSLHQGILVLSLQLLVQVLLLLSLHFRIVRSNFLLYLFCLFVFVIFCWSLFVSYRFTKGFLVLFLSSLDFSSYCPGHFGISLPDMLFSRESCRHFIANRSGKFSSCCRFVSLSFNPNLYFSRTR